MFFYRLKPGVDLKRRGSASLMSFFLAFKVIWQVPFINSYGGAMKSFALMFAAILISGCVLNGDSIPKSYMLKNNEGLLVFQTRCGNTFSVRIQEKSKNGGGFFWG